MSWSKKCVGDREGIMENVNADETIPPTVKNSIAQALDNFPEPDGTAILLETDGHLPVAGGGAYGTCKINLAIVSRAVKTAVIVLLVVLIGLASTVPARADGPNRACLTIGTAAAMPSDLGSYQDRSKQWGGNLQLAMADHVKFRITASRDERIPRSWLGSVGPAFQFGPLVLPVGVEYAQLTQKWGGVAGAGLQKCLGPACLEGVLRYHQGFNSGGDGFLGLSTGGESHFYSVDVGVGVAF